MLALGSPAAAQPQSPASAISAVVSPDPHLREAGRRALLELDRSDFDDLAEVVRGLPPGQQSLPELDLLLREAVDHIFLREAKEQYVAMYGRRDIAGRPQSFLGIVWRSERLRNFGMEAGPGIPVARCLPGFNAYEALQEGDVIIGVVTGDEGVRVNDVIELNQVIQSFPPGTRIGLRVLRAGEVQDVAFELDTRVDTTAPEFMELSKEALERADEVWRRRFLPAFRGDDASERDAAAPVTARQTSDGV